MKKLKMSQRGMSVARGTDAERREMERIEQQRIDFEHRASQARQNLYGQPKTGLPQGWVDKKSW
jgi:hypothetical protein